MGKEVEQQLFRIIMLLAQFPLKIITLNQQLKWMIQFYKKEIN